MMSYRDMYKYNGFYFEVSDFWGPIKLRKDGLEAKKMGRAFWKAYEEWENLPHEDKIKAVYEAKK